MRDNVEQRYDNIPYDELPSLYEDAITITRRFGIRYIWIDSLCIFQDAGDDDFAVEGAKMALIYEGAEFVLVATSFPNDDTGLCNYSSIKLRRDQWNDSRRPKLQHLGKEGVLSPGPWR